MHVSSGYCLQLIESLMVEDMKLRQDTTILINALGLNSTLTDLDIRWCYALGLLYVDFSVFDLLAAIVINNANTICIAACALRCGRVVPCGLRCGHVMLTRWSEV